MVGMRRVAKPLPAGLGLMLAREGAEDERVKKF